MTKLRLLFAGAFALSYVSAASSTEEVDPTFMNSFSFWLNRNNEHNVFVRGYRIIFNTRTNKNEIEYTHVQPDNPKVAETDPEYVHRLIEEMTEEWSKSFDAHWLVKGVAVRQHYKAHEDVFVLYHDTKTNDWYRATYAFGYNGAGQWYYPACFDSYKRKSMLVGNIQKSSYNGTDDKKAARSFPNFRETNSPLVFFPQGNGGSVVFPKAMRELFLKRVEGLTAARFHQLMWPTTHDTEPKERIFKKYRLLPVTEKRTNCIGFATHVAWLLGLHKILIFNLGLQNHQFQDVHLLPLPKQRLTVGGTPFQPKSGPGGWGPSDI